jgi:hypothetical protein
MISIAMLLAAHGVMPIKTYPTWELYRHERGCTLVGHFTEDSVMQITEDAGAYRTFIGIRHTRLGDVAAGRSYAIAPVPMADGTPDGRYVPIAATGVANGYVMTLKGDGILKSMARSQQIRFPLAGGRSVMTVNYGPIAEQMDDLRQCARAVLDGQIGSPSMLRAEAFAPMPMGPRYSR